MKLIIVKSIFFIKLDIVRFKNPLCTHYSRYKKLR